MADRQRPFIDVVSLQGPTVNLERDGERPFLN